MSKPSLHLQIEVPMFGYKPETDLLKAYTAALRKEIEAAAGDLAAYQVKSLWIKNASRLGEHNLTELFFTLRSLNLLHDGIEKTASVLPNRMNSSVYTPLANKNFHFYRFHLGSLNVNDFARLQYPYDLNTYFLLFKLLDTYHIHNYCAEIDVGIVKQTQLTLHNCLDQVIARAPQQICLVPAASAGNEQLSDLFAHAHEQLLAAGYMRTSIFEYALPGYASSRVTDYFSDPDTLAFGLGAVSRLDGCLLQNTRDIPTYLEKSDDMESILSSVNRLDGESVLKSRILHGLYNPYGISKDLFNGQLKNFAQDLIRDGFASCSERIIRLTIKGIANSENIWKKLDQQEVSF